MLAEFPTVAELLALAVGAGEGAVGALDRVCRLSHGELAGELRRCLADARAGRQPADRAAGAGRPHRPDAACAASSTGSSSPSSAARRWPTCCAPRRRTSARPGAAPLMRPAAARRSR